MKREETPTTGASGLHHELMLQQQRRHDDHDHDGADRGYYRRCPHWHLNDFLNLKCLETEA